MEELDIELIYAPVPHVIVRNLYTPEELKLIWRELEFLTSPFKMSKGILNGSHPLDPITKMPLANGFAVSLDHIYAERKISDILTLNRKIFNAGLVEGICNLSPLIGHLRFINSDTTKIKYYETGEYYKGHHDSARFTFLTYFFREPKKFIGGDLHFDEYNYTIPIENNMGVFFVGSAIHSSTEVRMNEGYDRFSGYGKYVMTQFLNVND